MKMLLKNRKNIENHHCGGGPKANSARGLFSLLLLGPEPDSQRMGNRKGPPRRRPHGPHGPCASPRCQGAILAVDEDWTAVRAFRQPKTLATPVLSKP